MTKASALIVAAGRGVRMGQRGQLIPKGLLKVGGEFLVQRSVRLLQEQGIGPVRIVTGHLADQYEEIFASIAGVELIHNPLFCTTGSLQSLLTGLEAVEGSVVLLESDLIYERAALDPVSPDTSLIVVSGPTGAGDEVYIWTRQNAQGERVFDMMSKDPKARSGKHFGELTGISCFSETDTRGLKASAQHLLAQDAESDYETAVVHLAQTTDIECPIITDLAWTEIDDERMFARAKSDVWPEIEKRDARR